MFKNKYGRIILLIFLLFIIPASNASDNNADLIEINYGETNSNNALLNEKVNIADDIISVDSPHKELTDEDLKNDSCIYLINGEYDYKQEYEHRNITFIGEDTSKTIINGNGSTIHITEFLSFNNLTLKNIKIYAPENLIASNVIFKDFKYDESEWDQTGIIYNDYSDSSNINLVNCSFYNNTQLDYGIIEIHSGTLNIKDSKILKNSKSSKKNLVIQFNDYNYNTALKTVKITINKEKTKITAKAKTFKKSKKIKKYSILLKNSKGKAMKKAKVTLKVKGKTYAAKTNSKGKATFKITKLAKKGTYKAIIKYKGDKYYKKATKNMKIKIK